MPTSTGTSVRGLQLLGGFPGTREGWQIRFASAQNVDRLQRQGTVILCRPITNARFPAIAVYKLFGGGISPETLDYPPGIPVEVWVNWFIAGRSWFFERPDP